MRLRARIGGWLGRPARPATTPLTDGELARAARVLALRTRRQSAGILTGVYASAFRGGGMEFDESRPYVPGDDPRHFDWNAMARTGEPFVKHFREERDLTLLLALDVSRSMAFGPSGRSKAARAAQASALIAAAAERAGDRVGLVAFDETVQARIAPARGAAHTSRLVRRALELAARPGRETALEPAVQAALAMAESRCITVLLSDFRGLGLDVDPSSVRTGLGELARRHDLVSAVLTDPREQILPRAGRVRLADPEARGRTLAIDTDSPGVRARHRAAWLARREALERTLRRAGSDVVWLRTDRDPLQPLVHYFQQRAQRRGRAA